MRTPEQNEIIGAFAELLAGPTGDGARKRAAGLKAHWKVDAGHYAAAARHWDRWLAGETVDPDSGCHPLVHTAWRCLAIAYQETHPDECGDAP